MTSYFDAGKSRARPDFMGECARSADFGANDRLFCGAVSNDVGSFAAVNHGIRLCLCRLSEWAKGTVFTCIENPIATLLTWNKGRVFNFG